ncbi:hypothetical protein PLESTB_001768300 [Pleodorina starrii]|uniref:Uncharacterized protein n=1 Tax=Pleodorina starrii TaxID=330485 RepID=A0A9W6FAC7_9CHLO|nr:hypothetical protein PLESTM_001863500 [Pleodorina starrii]GLC61546.1 hypothetical protein PLESTB_001768300 [Pleodorina starrii]GLC76824.1 hypothetical protein PLESTF_001845100 [Pleodorina starrii]
MAIFGYNPFEIITDAKGQLYIRATPNKDITLNDYYKHMATEFMKQHEQKLAALNADFEAKLKEQETEVQSWQEHAAQTANALSDLIRDKEALETANRQLEAANRALLADFSRLQQQFDEQEVALADRTQQWEEACKRTAVLEPLQQQVAELSRQVESMAALRRQRWPRWRHCAIRPRRRRR